jgi:RHS repeat-associated protein
MLIALTCWSTPVRAQTAEFTQANKGSNTMTMQVPLGSYPGRGVSLPINLNYSSQGLWRIGFLNSVYVNVYGYQIRRSVAEAIYAEHSTAGWTTSLNVPEVEWPKQNDIYWYTGKPYASGSHYPYTFRISRVFIHMPDGSTHELRKADAVQQDNGSIDMSGTFYAVDGSRMRYDSSAETTGVLYLGDGSRYVLSGSTTQYIDRNGNTLSYNAANRQWTDTMGRVFGMPWPANPGAGDYSYSVPGVNGTSINYTLKFRNLSSVFLPDATGQTQKPLGDYYLPTPYAPPSSSNLPQATGASTHFSSDYSDPDMSEASYTYVVGRGQFGAATFDPVVLAEIALPNGQSYRFSYNALGELDKVFYPTGGYQRYQYGAVATLGGATVPYVQGTRGITSRWVSPSGSGGDEAQWTYSGATWPLTVTAPNGVRSETYLYNAAAVQANNFGYPDARNGMPVEERIYAPAAQGGAMLRRTLTDYEQGCTNMAKPVPPNTSNTGNYTACRNARPIKTVSLILDTGGNALASTTTTSYDATYQFTVGPDATSSSQYDYAAVDQTTAQSGAIGSIPTGALIRTTTTSNLTGDANYRNRNILGLPVTSTVYNASGATVAQSTISYDESSYPLYNYGSITGWIDPGTTIRGNATTVSKWLDSTNSYIQSHTQYDQAGSPINSWDPKGNLSQTAYSSSYAYAYPTVTISPVPDPSGTYGSTTSLSGTSVYDFNTGLVTSTTDANSKTTTFEYNDPLNRQTRVNLSDGGYTRHIYVDAHQCGPYVESRTLVDTSGRETDSYQFVDGLGRVYRAFSYENQDTGNPYLTVDTQYDSMGRAWRTSSPYRSSGCTSTINPSGRWTQTSFDALSRPTQILTTVDNAAVTTSYSGSTVTVTDPAGKTRRSVSDAMGRLSAVYEDPNGANYLTNYLYDALGNLRRVDQGGQARFFMYDSLGRLIRAKNPEQDAGSVVSNMADPVTGNTQWSMGYGYDYDGNLTVRTDARNVQTTYGYDALNRTTTVRYTDGTKDIDRHYDGAINGRGRFYYSNWDPNNNTRFDTHLAIDEYDAMGRPKNYRQHFLINGVATPQFNVKRTYDYAGNVLTQTYPSGHTVNYTYDIAGRISNYSGTLGDGVSRTYSTGISFSEFGGLQQEQFGTQTPLYHKLHYNARGQLYDIRLSTNSLQANEFDWNRGCLAFYYGGAAWGQSSATNNGNVNMQQHWSPADESYSNYLYTQDSYSYDSLNRISSTNEVHGGPWGVSAQDDAQVYNYDRFGNRTVDQNQTTTNVPRPAFTIDPSTNRLIAPSGYNYGYDAAGNQTNDTYTGEGNRSYDAENRLKQAWANNQSQTYTYDADGRRIKRLVNGTETWQLYGMGGELLAEYKSGAAAFLPTKEYGYRGGELLVTMASGDDARLSRFVTNLYYGALQRDPTSTELQNGINTLASAGAQSQSQLLTAASNLARGLFTQTGYETSPYRSDIQYVADLYYTYLQRAPDDSGLNWWAGQAAGNRANVCNAFEASSEFQTLVATLYGTATSDNQRTEQLVNNFYLAAYGRNATSTELQQQRDALNAAAAQGLAAVQAQVESMGRSLFAGQVNDYSISDQQFVTNLYEAFMQRGPDAGGLGFWTSIASGGSANRQNVLNAFAPCGPARELAGTLYREEFWLVNDRLGTPRMIIDKSGSLASVRRHDYLPFGEEVYAGTGGRTTAQGYMSDSTRQKFTGYEYDAETGLNFAHARYQSNVQGRFTSVDPLMASASLDDPQSLNRYSYVQNDPVNMDDPSGMVPNVPGWGDVANGFWGKDLNDNGPHFGGPEAIGEALMHNQSRENNWLSRIRAGLPGIAGADVIVTNIFAFHSREEAIAYYKKQFGGSVYEQSGRFYPTALTRARNFTAGMIDYGVGPPPILGWSLGRVLRLGADSAVGNYADEDSGEYYAGSWVPDVVAAAFGGEAGLVDEAGLRLGGKFEIHTAHHKFKWIGKRSHFQLLLYSKGTSGSHWIQRAALPFKNIPARSKTLFKF